MAQLCRSCLVTSIGCLFFSLGKEKRLTCWRQKLGNYLEEKENVWLVASKSKYDIGELIFIFVLYFFIVVIAFYFIFIFYWFCFVLKFLTWSQHIFSHTMGASCSERVAPFHDLFFPILWKYLAATLHKIIIYLQKRLALSHPPKSGLETMTFTLEVWHPISWDMQTALKFLYRRTVCLYN